MIVGGKPLRRPEDENPHSPTCRLALRRICGTCAAFDGELRQAARGACTIYRTSVHPQAAAAGCARWARKTKGG